MRGRLRDRFAAAVAETVVLGRDLRRRRAAADVRTSQKLTEVKERLHCEDLDCVFTKICERSHDERQTQSNTIFSDDVKAQVRAALTTCQSSQ
ncbi:hypothetical protein HPB49_003452 [Dermacentor silvarum]|uniref:Uncharacterized protein n=1 Tax=Dermacentor silvarum TaxID=543639 RepID=A0ACB8CV44_DERSI|nr:hypothetical protein HPB49_003452 [Dermacentor silvarum]